MSLETMSAEWQMTGEPKRIREDTNEFCLARGVDLDEIWKAENMRAIALKNALIVYLHYKGHSISKIEKASNADQDYVQRVIKERRSQDFPIRTTNWGQA